MTILLCDIGGTHIRFAASEPEGAMCQPEKLRVDRHSSLEDAVTRYLSSQSIRADDVTHLYLAFSNRSDWLREQAVLQTGLPNAQLRLVNDFEANALGILYAEDGDFEVLHAVTAPRAERSSKVVLGVGTGLGIAYIVGEKGSEIVQQTHGGHMLPALSVQDHRDIFDALAANKTDGSISIYEDVLSGGGLFNLYRLLCHRSHLNPEYHDVADLLISGKDDPVMQLTMRFFHEILGVFTHQAVAFGYSYGGVYLTGGIIDKLKASGLFDTETFLASFHQNNIPVVKNNVLATPVHWIRDEFVSLRGLLRQAHIDIKEVPCAQPI